jgi:hypothetical protein
MKSFIFCTSFLKDAGEYADRYQKWINYYRSISFSDDKDIFVIDDGSEEINLKYFEVGGVINGYETNIIREPNFDLSRIFDINLYHYDQRIGVDPHTNAMQGSTLGWYRSFFTSYKIAKELGYTKIIHLESDAYLISQKICNYIDDLNSGWTSFRCPKYNFPETSIQVICEDQFDNLGRMAKVPIETYKMCQAENIIPFTHIETDFVGDRYGESTHKQFPGLDYYNQCQLDTVIKFNK